MMLDIDKLVLDPPEPGCALYLPGLPGGGNKIHDRSPYGNIGAITGATWKRLPSGLWYLDFDGTDDYVDCGDDTSVLPDTFTVMVWIKWDNITDDRSVICWGNTSIDPGFYIFNNEFRLSGHHSNNYRTFTFPTGFATGIWYQLAFTRPGNADDDIESSEAYINAQSLAVSATGNTAPGRAKVNLYIGVRRDNNTDIDAKMSLFRLYNRVLNQSEIRNHFNRERNLFGV